MAKGRRVLNWVRSITNPSQAKRLHEKDPTKREEHIMPSTRIVVTHHNICIKVVLDLILKAQQIVIHVSNFNLRSIRERLRFQLPERLQHLLHKVSRHHWKRSC